MANSKNLRTLVENSFDSTDTAYQELVKLVRAKGGEINFTRVQTIHRVRFVYLNSSYQLKGEFITRLRLTDCVWNGELEVLPEYSDPDDECEWIAFAYDHDFVQFNLNDILEGIEALERVEKFVK